MSGEQRKSGGCLLLAGVLWSSVVNVSLLGNFRAGSREREPGLGGKRRRRGKAGEKKEKKKKTPHQPVWR